MTTRHVGRVAFATATLTALLVSTACGSSSTATPGASSSSTSVAAPAVSTAAPAGSSSAESSAAGPGSSAAASTAGGSTAAPGPALPAAKLDVLIGSSGPAETGAVPAAAAAWGKASGSTATVAAAQDLTQQLAQGFAAGKAPDVFYVGADQVANYAKAGNLLAYGDQLTNKADFYPSLVQSFTYDSKFYCAPKDFSTLALFINTDMWTKAGLTDADIPKNWDALATVAKKLTEGKVAGLAMSPEHDRLDAFMVQNGSNLVDAEGKPTVNDQKNIDALAFAKKLYTDGSMKWPKDLGAGWAGEAFGKGQAAMTIEGNWLLGALKSDFPDIKYTVAELPAGPTGTKGTLVFTNCWGIAATTKFPEQAKSFVEYMTGTDQQMKFATAFGVIPSVQSAQADYLSQFPANEPFVKGVDYARGVVNLPGITDVLADFNSQLQDLANADPQAILDSVQENLTAAVGG